MAQKSKRFPVFARAGSRTWGPAPRPRRSGWSRRINTTKFDQSVEVATHLGIDPKQSDQMVRGSVALPHGIGKTKRVPVFAQGDNAKRRRRPGPTSSGPTTCRSEIKGGTDGLRRRPGYPGLTGVVGPLGRVLGPRG